METDSDKDKNTSNCKTDGGSTKYGPSVSRISDIVTSDYFGNADRSLDDFVPPKPPKKPSVKPQSKTNKKTKKKVIKDRAQTDIRKVLSRKQLTSIQEEIRDVCTETSHDVDPDQLQLALALSESVDYKSKPSTLEHFGFRPKARVERAVPVSRVKSKRRKPYLLLTRSDSDKKQTIYFRYFRALRNVVTHNNEFPSNGEKTLFEKAQLSYLEMDDSSVFYVDDLIEKSTAPLGNKLKNWNEIPGRDPSPVRNTVPIWDTVDLTKRNDLDLIMSGTRQVCRSSVPVIPKSPDMFADDTSILSSDHDDDELPVVTLNRAQTTKNCNVDDTKCCSQKSCRMDMTECINGVVYTNSQKSMTEHSFVNDMIDLTQNDDGVEVKQVSQSKNGICHFEAVANDTSFGSSSNSNVSETGNATQIQKKRVSNFQLCGSSIFNVLDETEESQSLPLIKDCEAVNETIPAVNVTPQNKNYITKTDNLTPLLAYEAMGSPEVNEYQNLTPIGMKNEKVIHSCLRLSKDCEAFNETFSTVNVTPQNKNYIVKANNVTPLPGYEAMGFPELNKSQNFTPIGMENEEKVVHPRLRLIKDCEAVNETIPTVNVTPHNKNYIVKTDNVTPLPDYEAMGSPELNECLDHFGIRNLKRKRAVQLLQHIYYETHPVVTYTSDNESPSSTEKSLRAGKRKKLFPEDNILSGKELSISDQSQDTKNSAESSGSKDKIKKPFSEVNILCSKELCRSDQSQNTKNSTESICSKDDFQTELYLCNRSSAVLKPLTCEEEDWIFQKREKAKVQGCRVPLHISFHNYLSARPELRDMILRYEPVSIDSIHKGLTMEGYRYDPKDLFKFLDKKCITVQTVDKSGPSRHVRKPPGKRKK